jgi:hypothetical protein
MMLLHPTPSPFSWEHSAGGKETFRPGSPFLNEGTLTLLEAGAEKGTGGGMHWDPTWHAGMLWMQLLWWVFWLAMATLVWFIVDRSTKGPGGGTTL